mgnify:FL=1
MDMIKVAVIGTIGSLLALALKSAKGEFSTYINLSACVLIMLYLAARLSGIVSQLEFMTEYVDIDSDYIMIMLKMAGLAYIAEFSSSLCRDMGYSALAVQIENFGKLSLLFLSCPIVVRLLEMVGEML